MANEKLIDANATDKELQTAIEALKNEYEKAKKLDGIANPIAYAVYKVWKLTDKRNVEVINLAYETGYKQGKLDAAGAETPAGKLKWEEVEPKGWGGKVYSGYYATPRYRCPVCHKDAVLHKEEFREHGGSVAEYRWEKTPACPHCGAKMDGDGNGNL